MKKVCIVVILFLAVFQLFADDDDKIKLAVMDFEDLSGKVSKETLSGASEYLRVAFASTNRFLIISQDRQKSAISDMRKKFNTDPTYKSCTDKNCQIQLGQALSADMIVKTTISFFAGSYTISSELIDLEKEATIIAAKEDYDGSPTSLKSAINNIVSKIIDAEKSQTSANIPSGDTKNSVKQNTNTAYNPIQDEQTCNQTREKNNLAGWEDYIAVYPEGKCSKEAKTNIQNLKNKPANWSNRSPNIMNWADAVNYCKNLTEDGHDDWRLPNISEWREMIFDCPKTESGGECKIRKDNRSVYKWKLYECACTENLGAHSKLGDSYSVWSSTKAALTFGTKRYAFFPADGGIAPIVWTMLAYVRCIRDEKK